MLYGQNYHVSLLWAECVSPSKFLCCINSEMVFEDGALINETGALKMKHERDHLSSPYEDTARK